VLAAPHAQASTALEMTMPIIIAILSVALLIWAEPANAQKTYSVSISSHTGVPALTEDDVKQILADAAKMLQKPPGHPDTDEDAACNVAFTLKGPVRTFASPSEPVLFDKSDIDAVQAVDADVDADFHIKIVEKILFCRDTPGEFHGCGYPPQYRSITVIHPQRHAANFPAHVLWAHEFGHLTGLGHRKDTDALMKCGGVTDTSVRLKRDECRCLLMGPNNQMCQLPPAFFC
jgi:hypothetical protein